MSASYYNRADIPVKIRRDYLIQFSFRFFEIRKIPFHKIRKAAAIGSIERFSLIRYQKLRKPSLRQRERSRENENVPVETERGFYGRFCTYENEVSELFSESVYAHRGRRIACKDYDSRAVDGKLLHDINDMVRKHTLRKRAVRHIVAVRIIYKLAAFLFISFLYYGKSADAAVYKRNFHTFIYGAATRDMLRKAIENSSRYKFSANLHPFVDVVRYEISSVRTRADICRIDYERNADSDKTCL